MSAIVCGGKRSFFEELSSPSPPSSSSSVVSSSKRLRCSSTSPIRFSPSSTFSSPPPSSGYNPFLSSPSAVFACDRSNTHIVNITAAVNHLVSVFPDMEKQLLERALEECGNDLDSAIKSLTQLRLTSAENNTTTAEEKAELPSQGVEITGATTEDPSVDNLPKNGSEWVELFVSEMTSASNMDDARARASRVLEVLEKSIRTHASAEAAQNFQKEHILLKEQMEVLIRENTILKRAVTIQHERQKEYDGKNQELQQLKQLVAQYQEQLRTLEVNNYALTMHLRQAQQSSSISGRFHPDVF